MPQRHIDPDRYLSETPHPTPFIINFSQTASNQSASQPLLNLLAVICLRRVCSCSFTHLRSTPVYIARAYSLPSRQQAALLRSRAGQTSSHPSFSRHPRCKSSLDSFRRLASPRFACCVETATKVPTADTHSTDPGTTLGLCQPAASPTRPKRASEQRVRVVIPSLLNEGPLPPT